MEKNRIQALADLLKETGHAHHQAFMDTEGVDPEWALFYAEYLEQPLSELLGQKLTRSRIIFELVRLADIGNEGDKPWPVAYAEDLVKRYG